MSSAFVSEQPVSEDVEDIVELTEDQYEGEQELDEYDGVRRTRWVIAHSYVS
jgi:hypothetical protein